jgi:hypothetical protein
LVIERNVEITRSEYRPKALKTPLGDNSKASNL